MFPREWISPQGASGTQQGSTKPPGKPPTQWAMPTAVPGASTMPTKPPQQREDTRHPKIKLLMDPYLKRYNNFVGLSDILTACGKRMTDLPTIPIAIQQDSPFCAGTACWGGVSAAVGASTRKAM